MKKFIESLVNKNSIINYQFGEYETLFIKEKYDSFYLFFFLDTEEKLEEIQRKTNDIYQSIKEMEKKVYNINMDKNTTCIYCLKVKNDRFYSIEESVSDNLMRLQCMIEENLVRFKKNVLIYSEQMNQYAVRNIGRFDEMCKEQLTDIKFQSFKEHRKENYELDFIISLFIKIPFLSYNAYQNMSEKRFVSAKEFIDKISKSENLNVTEIKNTISELEGIISNEEDLYKWLDKEIEKEEVNNI